VAHHASSYERYLHTAQQRLAEQVTEAVEAIGNYAGEAVVGTQETVSTYAQPAREGVERLAKSAAEEAGEGIRKMSDAASDVSDKAVGAAYRATSEFNRAVSDPDIRDQLLLGVAGLAVVAAVGLAYQGRSD
jgi:hypothetical protein